MKILVATPYLQPAGGGLERYAHEISAQLAKAGHEVVEIGHAKEPVEDADGVRRVAIPLGARISNTPIPLRARKAAHRLLREERFDVVSVHTPVPGTAEAVAWAARRNRVPFVVTYHAGVLEGPGLLDLAAWIHRRTLERALLAGAAGRIAVSSFVADNVFRGRAEVIPPGVDTERFRPLGEPEPGRILFVGPVDRAYKWKGLATLRDAFARVAAHSDVAQLRIVGRGDLVESYRAWFADHGLAERVSFAGRVTDDMLVAEYNRASVAVLPSWSAAESFGMVLAEANACARPVIGSHVGGIPSFVRDGENGLVVAPRVVTELANAIELLLDDPKLAREMGERGRARVEREHRWPELAQRTASVLERAVESAAAGRRATPSPSASLQRSRPR